MYPTDLTVATVVEYENRFLFVEEHAMGRRVLTQPGGHIEADESPEEAAVREVFEEAGCVVACEDLIGVYLWIHPQTRQQFLRIAFNARFLSWDDHARLDDGILHRRWMSVDDVRARRKDLRTPVVLKCVEDYLAGKRETDNVLSSMLPLQQNVHRILASADLV